MSTPYRIFVSYCHADESYKDDLLKHMGARQGMHPQPALQGLVEVWTDRGMLPSASLRKEIDEAIASTDIFLLLVSADWFASDFIHNVEMKAALERHAAGLSMAVPIIVRPCSWLGTDLASIMAVPRDGKPISTWRDKDEAWCDVVRGIRALVEGLPPKLASRSPAPTPRERETDEIDRRFPEPFSKLG